MLCAFLPWVPKSVEEPCHKPCKKTFKKSSVEFKSCWFELEGGGEHKDFSVWPHWIPVQVVGTEKCKMVDLFHPETINTWTRSKPVVRVLHQPLSQQTDHEDQTGRWLDRYGFPDSFVDWYVWASTSALPLGRPQVGPGMAEGIHTPLLYMHRNRGRTAFVCFDQGLFTGSQFPAAGLSCCVSSLLWGCTAPHRVTEASHRMSPQEGPSCGGRSSTGQLVDSLAVLFKERTTKFTWKNCFSQNNQPPAHLCS